MFGSVICVPNLKKKKSADIAPFFLKFPILQTLLILYGGIFFALGSPNGVSTKGFVFMGLGLSSDSVGYALSKTSSNKSTTKTTASLLMIGLLQFLFALAFQLFIGLYLTREPIASVNEPVFLQWAAAGGGMHGGGRQLYRNMFRGKIVAVLGEIVGGIFE